MLLLIILWANVTEFVGLTMARLAVGSRCALQGLLPILSLSGPGHPKSMKPPEGEPWGPKEGAHQRGQNQVLLPLYIQLGMWGRNATSCKAGAIVPHPVPEG